MRLLIITILAVLFCIPVFGATGAKFLTLEAGARPVGMGGAFTSMAGDPYAAAYNPAAVFGIESLSGAFGHDTYWSNRNFESGYLSFKKGAVAYNLGLKYSKINGIEARQGATEVPDYLFESHDFSAKFAGSFRMNEKVIAGLSIGWLFEKIDMNRDNSFTMDFGMLVTPFDKLRFGAAALNVGSKIKLNYEQFDIPTTLSFGASYEYQNFLPSADIIYFDDEVHLHFGGEYNINDVLYLRAGYRSGYDTKDISAGAGFTQRNIRIDYAFLPYKSNLGDSHIFSLTFSL